MNISIPEEDRQPVHITPRFDPRNILPDPPRTLARGKPRKNWLPIVEKFLIAALTKTTKALLLGLGLLVIYGLVTAFPDLKWPLLAIYLYVVVMRGIKGAVREGVIAGNSTPAPPRLNS